MYRQTGRGLEVLLVHPGGPFWRSKDDGAWSIPKGEFDEDEDAAIAARREFLEETGCALTGPLEPLGDIRQRGGKQVTAFAVEGDIEADSIQSNSFETNGRRKAGGCNPSLRSTARRGSICPQHTSRFSTANGRFLIGWPNAR